MFESATGGCNAGIIGGLQYCASGYYSRRKAPSSLQPIASRDRREQAAVHGFDAGEH